MINLHLLNSTFNDPSSSHRKLVIEVRLRLSVQDILLAVHLKVVCSFRVSDDMLYQ